MEKKEESVKKEIEKIKIKIQTKRELSPREQEINQFAPKFKSLRALYTQYTKYLSDIEKLIGKITELEKAIEELRQKISDFKEKIVIFGRSENLEDELYKIYKNNYKPVKDIYQELEASLQDIENVGKKISKEVKEYEAEIPSGMLSVIKIKDTEIDKGLLNFKECLRKVKKDIEEIGGLFSSIKKVLQSFEQCIRIGNFEEGKFFLEKGLSNASQIDDSTTLGYVEFFYGLFFFARGDWNSTIEHLENSIKYYEEAK